MLSIRLPQNQTAVHVEHVMIQISCFVASLQLAMGDRNQHTTTLKPSQFAWMLSHKSIFSNSRYDIRNLLYAPAALLLVHACGIGFCFRGLFDNPVVLMWIGHTRKSVSTLKSEFSQAQAILRPWRLDGVIKALNAHGIRGLTVSDVAGIGFQGGACGADTGVPR